MKILFLVFLVTGAASASCLSDKEKDLINMLDPETVAALLDEKTCGDIAEGIDFGALEDERDEKLTLTLKKGGK